MKSAISGMTVTHLQLLKRYPNFHLIPKISKVYRKNLKYTDCLLDLIIKSKLELSDIKKEMILNCINLICLSELCPSFHWSFRASRVSIGYAIL